MLFKCLSRRAVLAMLLLPLWWLGLLSLAPAENARRPWRVCVVDTVVPPFLTGDPANPGTVVRILMAAGLETGLETGLFRYPSRRCRAMLEARKLDAEIRTPTPDNLAVYQFPMKAGMPDSGRRICTVNVVWVKRAESPYEWTDAGMVGGGAPASLSVGTRATLRAAIEPLKEQGFQIDSGASNTAHLLQKLALKRIELAVSLEGEVQLQLQQDPRLAGLVVLAKPLNSANYYMTVRKGLPPETMEIVENWWTVIGRLRDAPEFRTP